MVEIEWQSIAPCLLNLLGNCELGFEEATYPIAANVFNGVELDGVGADKGGFCSARIKRKQNTTNKQKK